MVRVMIDKKFFYLSHDVVDAMRKAWSPALGVHVEYLIEAARPCPTCRVVSGLLGRAFGCSAPRGER
jgi:hypothetical protein